ncbi:MAG: hypothetical protein C4290_07300 [Chloroflexota bacterium]
MLETEPGFVVGERYASRAGVYEVLAVIGGKVHIRYEQGLEMTLPAQGLWAQWQALRAARDTAPSPPRPTAPSHAVSSGQKGSVHAAKGKVRRSEASFYLSVGYLAAGCEITAVVAGRDYAAFAQRYNILTGRNLVTPRPGLTVHERPTYRMGAELTVRFPADAATLAELDLGEGVTIEPMGPAGWYGAKQTELVERLLRLGFDLGRVVDPAPIRGRVPAEHRPAFDRGVSLRRHMARGPEPPTSP